MSEKAIVLVSGGLDSATCLALAKEAGYVCCALSFDYGQRSSSELAAAARIASAMQVADHRVVKLGLDAIGGSALTDTAFDVPEQESEGIPITYVPARNTVFLAYGLALAEAIDAASIFIGVNSLDYSGYPDCRPEYIEAFQAMMNLATKKAVEGSSISLNTPLISLSKAEIIKTGTLLNVDYSQTVSCYQADDRGRACGSCDSCRFRRQGFLDAGVPDPTKYQD
ncbi:MAG: 7-cyano-7-deazaguanine synthase QueC [Pseudomonadales bacterium]|jgi:7-cyano-7-deazaguanine synthase|nr:7-cyano-7-deazaguanine synthase QueC [Pseudomonadales bacterium]MBL6816404.1 7-cyano-7-deazaguanine synthase QueC [Pseudomonadales bacterium]MCH1598997.1 7-cyano-7-deazaguanine synthase QueC [Pseudomonadales bacterium]